MASLFDPTAFIEAEKRERSQALASTAIVCDQPSECQKAREIRQLADSPTPALATFATLAAQGPENSIYSRASALMEALPLPSNMTIARWSELRRLVKWIAEDWGDVASAAGWHPLEFFGCNPDPWAGRCDRNGIIMTVFRMASPVTISAVLHDRVEMTDRSGSIMRFRRFGPRGQVYLWEAYAPKGGP